MSYNGSGTFVINTAGQPVVSGTVISSTAFNALTADLATGLSTAITKDGQTTPTANIPMGNNKITGLAVGTAATDAANLSQVQSTAAKLVGSVSGVDTITGTMSPTLAAYAAGQMFYFVAAGDNTGAVTLNLDGLGAKSVTRDGSVALAAGDIKSGEVVVVVYDGTRFQVVSQLNSSGDARFANVSITSALNVGGVATFSGGTANGVTYLNASKALTSGSALTFDGTNLGVGTASGTSSGFSTAPNLLVYGATNANILVACDSSNVGVTSARYTNTTGGGILRVGKYRGTYASPSAAQTGDTAGDVRFEVWGGSNLRRVASVAGTVETFTSDTDISGYLAFNTTSSGSTTPTEKMRLDSSGNLGLGVTPSAWSGYKVIQIGQNGAVSSADSAAVTMVNSNCYFDGSQYKYISSAEASLYQQASGAHNWRIAASGTAGNTISFTQAMTLDASGNLGVGETSPSTYGRLVVRGGGTGSDGGTILAMGPSGMGSITTNDDLATLSFGGGTATYTSLSAAKIFVEADAAWGSGDYPTRMSFWTTADGASSATERARITSGGNFLVGTTSVTSSNFALQTISEEGILARGTANGGSSFFSTLTSGNSGGYHYYGYNTATTSAVFYVLYNGDVRNTNNSYAAISDIKLKEDVVDAASQWDDIKNLRVRKYRFKSDPTSPPQIGVIAQELEQVSPGLVEDVVDRDENNLDLGTITKSVKYSVLYMKAVKALQEAMARIEQLEAKVTALETK